MKTSNTGTGKTGAARRAFLKKAGTAAAAVPAAALLLSLGDKPAIAQVNPYQTF